GRCGWRAGATAGAVVAPADVAASADLDLPRGHDVDVVAGLERAGHQLVLVTLDLVRTLRALDLRADALLLRRSEAARGHLLTLVDVLRRDVLGQLLGARDRTGDDGLLRHRHLLQHVLVDDFRATRPRRDVLGGDVHRDLVLAVLHVALVVDDVNARQDGGEGGQRDGDADVLDAVVHSPFSFV